MRVLTHPAVATALFIGSLYGLYFTGLFDTLMTNHLGHAAMELHFLLVGCLFFYVLIGVDPSPRKLPPFAALALLLIVMPFHAFFSIAIMSSSTVLGAGLLHSAQPPVQHRSAGRPESRRQRLLGTRRTPDHRRGRGDLHPVVALGRTRGAAHDRAEDRRPTATATCDATTPTSPSSTPTTPSSSRPALDDPVRVTRATRRRAAGPAR